MASTATARKTSATRKGQVPRPRKAKSVEQTARKATTSKPRKPKAKAVEPEPGHRGVGFLPTMRMPSVRMPAGAAGNVVWWGGLAGLAAFGVVEWPVAAIVAAGSWVAEQRSRQERQAAR